MPRNGSGTYTLPQPAFVPNTTISSAAVNTDFSDIANALTQSVSADGQTPITNALKFPSGSAAAPGITFSQETTTGMYWAGSGIVGFSGVGDATVFINANNIGTGQNGALLTYANGAVLTPVGMVTDFAGATAPAGWMLCYGQPVSRTGYPELFTVIGTTYGIGDGSTTFNLPDLRGRTGFGVDNMGGVAAGRISAAGDNFDGTVLGNTGGFQNQTLDTANLAAHAHALSSVTIPITDPGHTHTVTDPGHDHTYTIDGDTGTLGTSGSSGASGFSNVMIYNSTDNRMTINTDTTGITNQTDTTGITAAVGGGDVTDNTGSGVSFSIMPPAFILNKIIFAGRP